MRIRKPGGAQASNEKRRRCRRYGAQTAASVRVKKSAALRIREAQTASARGNEKCESAARMSAAVVVRRKVVRGESETAGTQSSPT